MMPDKSRKWSDSFEDFFQKIFPEDKPDGSWSPASGLSPVQTSDTETLFKNHVATDKSIVDVV